MSLESDKARVEFILELTHDIKMIVSRHGSEAESLADFEGKHAILMCLIQIGETLNNIEQTELIVELPVSLAYRMVFPGHFSFLTDHLPSRAFPFQMK